MKKCQNKDGIDLMECTWKMLLNQYIDFVAQEKVSGTYPSLNGSTSVYEKLLAKAEDIFREEQNQAGKFISNSINIHTTSNSLETLRTEKTGKKKNLEEKIDIGLANSPRKVDTLDKKSRAYLTTSFYSVSLFTMSFFIYKQLKE